MYPNSPAMPVTGDGSCSCRGHCLTRLKNGHHKPLPPRESALAASEATVAHQRPTVHAVACHQCGGSGSTRSSWEPRAITRGSPLDSEQPAFTAAARVRAGHPRLPVTGSRPPTSKVKSLCRRRTARSLQPARESCSSRSRTGGGGADRGAAANRNLHVVGGLSGSALQIQASWPVVRSVPPPAS